MLQFLWTVQVDQCVDCSAIY